jgi:hypothetical protein
MHFIDKSKFYYEKIKLRLKGRNSFDYSVKTLLYPRLVRI